ncbi:MAG: type III secretion system chaperone [Succinivibrio sp.]|nr:type III secretion system chaperone [Succinivibrio sp.]
MTTDFNDFTALLKEICPDCAQDDDGIISFTLQDISFFVAPCPEDPSCALIRARVLFLTEVPRAGDFARAALSGNFFWNGTNGATLSAGPDEGLYLTERRPLDELADEAALRSCLDDFTSTAGQWQVRSALYA